MPIEAALIKPVVDALMALLNRGEKATLKRTAEAAIREAIRELLLAQPDENKAAARIAIARAAGILSADVLLAEGMLEKHRVAKASTTGKAATGRKRKPASSPVTPSVADDTAAKNPSTSARKRAPKKP